MRGNFIATEDVRTKLADRLHNVRTLGFVKPEKQKPIAAAAQMMGDKKKNHRERSGRCRENGSHRQTWRAEKSCSSRAAQYMFRTCLDTIFCVPFRARRRRAWA